MAAPSPTWSRARLRGSSHRASRVDAELARMDARDELSRARDAWEEREVIRIVSDSLDVATRRAP